MNTVFYYLLTFAEAIPGFFGIRAVYEQPRYVVVQQLGNEVELRDYEPRVAVETPESVDGREAFTRLFRYITGQNEAAEKIAMTAPVSRSGEAIAMTAPVQFSPGSGSGSGTMRFFLPRKVAARSVPKPLDPMVRIVTVPAQRIAALRFSGTPDRESVEQRTDALLAALSRFNMRPDGAPFQLTYDAPFTLPFVRRNEVAVALAPPR